MPLNRPPPSVSFFRSVPTSVWGPGSQTDPESSHEKLLTLPSRPSSAACTLTTSGTEGSDSRHVASAVPYNYENAVSEISQLTGPTARSEKFTIHQSPEKTKRSNDNTALTEMQELAECVGECLRKMGAEAVQDAAGNSAGKRAKLLQRISKYLRSRGLDLGFLTKPKGERTEEEDAGEVLIYVLVVFLGLGILERTAWAYIEIRKRLEHTPQEAPGIWGVLRRLSSRNPAHVVPPTVEQGIELPSLPTRPPSAHTVETRAPTSSAADSNH